MKLLPFTFTCSEKLIRVTLCTSVYDAEVVFSPHPIHHTIMSNNHTDVLKAIASLQQDVANNNNTVLNAIASLKQDVNSNTTTTNSFVLAFFKQNNIHWNAEVITAFSYFAISLATVLPLIIKLLTKRKRRDELKWLQQKKKQNIFCCFHSKGKSV